MIYKFTPVEKMLLKKAIVPQPIFDADSNPVLGRALSAAVSTGLTDALSTEFCSARDLAQQAQLSEEVTPLVLDCLEALGYVIRKNDSYAFSRAGKKFLSRDSPGNLVNYLLFSDRIHFRAFGNLDQVLTSGRQQRDNLSTFTAEEWKLFTLAMQDIAKINVEEVTRAIPRMQGKGRLLDLGGSHGLYSVYQCKRSQALQAEVLDMAAVRPYLEQNIRQYHLEDRLSFREGDFMVTDWGAGFDMIFAFNIIHGLKAADNAELFAKALRSLADGGLFIIFDQIKDMKGKSPLARAIPAYIGLNLYIQTGGRTYQAGELGVMLKTAGFSSIRTKRLHIPGTALLIATK
jgi:hypothetical protein